MKCGSCHEDCPEGYKFCPHCGEPLKAICPACGFANQAGGKFCGDCGSSLSAGAPKPKTSEAERRQLTVMFCDLVGSTALSERLDPEDLRDVITSYQDVAAKAIDAYGGYIARYMGDGLLIYFGYPKAHERDAERAVRAGLEIIANMAGRVALDGSPLEVRVGAATGMVVAGDIIGTGASEEHAVLGDTPNLAARLQGLAEPGTLVIASSTLTLAGKGFRSADLGEHKLKGIEKPVAAYRVEAALDASMQSLLASSRTTLLGRKAPLDTFASCWGNAAKGKGQALIVQGDPGIGKSRLIAAFHDHVQSGPFCEAIFLGSELHQNSALRPVQIYLNAQLGAGDHHDLWPALENWLKELDLSTEDHASILGDLLSLPSNEKYSTSDLGGAALRDQTTKTLIEIISAMAANTPLLLIIEDAQWLDASTLDLVGALLERAHKLKTVIVISARPEFHAPWPIDITPAITNLSRLDQNTARDIIAGIAGETVLPAETIDSILEHADGVPLYLEEITKSVIEAASSQSGTTEFAIPATLHDSLMARLDRLGSAKPVAQTAAVIGRMFERDLLQAVAKNISQDLGSALMDLITAELIALISGGKDGGFEFRHALIRDAAYQSLLIKTRKEIHHSIADTLESSGADRRQVESEVIAHHLTESGLHERAVPYWSEAARTAAARWANTEAISFCQKALACHRESGSSDTAQEVSLLLDMVASMRIVERSSEAMEALDLAERLSQQDGNISDLIRIHYLRGSMYFPTGNTDGCLREHNKARDLAREANSPADEARALSGIGDAHFLLGQITKAENHFDQAVEICRKHDLPEIEAPNLAMCGHMQLYLANADAALSNVTRAVEIATGLGNRRVEMLSQGSMLAKIHIEMGNWDEAITMSEVALEIAEDLGANRYKPMYLAHMAHALAAFGRTQEAAVAGERALELIRRENAYSGGIVFGTLAGVTEDRTQAEAYIAEGLQSLDEHSPAHNHLWFHHHVMYAAVSWKDWQRVHEHADHLSAYAKSRDIPWADYHVKRCRGLAAAGGGV